MQSLEVKTDILLVTMKLIYCGLHVCVLRPIYI